MSQRWSWRRERRTRAVQDREGSRQCGEAQKDIGPETGVNAETEHEGNGAKEQRAIALAERPVIAAHSTHLDRNHARHLRRRREGDDEADKNGIDERYDSE